MKRVKRKTKWTIIHYVAATSVSLFSWMEEHFGFTKSDQTNTTGGVDTFATILIYNNFFFLFFSTTEKDETKKKKPEEKTKENRTHVLP